MIKNGMGLARLNFSWGTHEEYRSNIQMIRNEARELKKKIPIIQDLSGPRVTKGNGHFFDKTIKKILTKKDLADLDFAKEQGIDFVAQSFVGDSRDVIYLRGEMARRNFNKPIIAKIERKKALENIDGIIAESDAIMIGRGDLGNEIALEEIPYVQSEIIKKAKRASKPVIVATEMMLSMMRSPIPTRADVSDTTCAIIEGADAVMLSEETAIGDFPSEAVLMMNKIILEAEKRGIVKKINQL